VLVHRIAYLVRVRREDPRGILALAFNRHAAVEIRERLAKLIGAIVDHGEQKISQILEQMLATPARVPTTDSAPPATVPVPDALRKYQVESTPASTYNVLLVERD